MRWLLVGTVPLLALGFLCGCGAGTRQEMPEPKAKGPEKRRLSPKPPVAVRRTNSVEATNQPPVVPADTNGFARIAMIMGTESAATLVRSSLAEHGIRCSIGGGSAFSVAVPPADKAKAVAVLEAVSRKYSFPVAFE